MKKIVLSILLIIFGIGVNACAMDFGPQSTQPKPSEPIDNPTIPAKDNKVPQIKLEKDYFSLNETIDINVENAIVNDRVAIYHEKDEPGRGVPIKQAIIKEEKSFSYSVSELELTHGFYVIYLYQNKTFNVYDRQEIRIFGDDLNDYAVKEANPRITSKDNIKQLALEITPANDLELGYRIYWANNGEILEGYTAIKKIRMAANKFTINFNPGMIMPDEANGMVITVDEGLSSNLFITLSDELKAPKETIDFQFQVVSDIHSNTKNFFHWGAHLNNFFLDVKELANDTQAIFTTGDNTDMGGLSEYQRIFQIRDNVFSDNAPKMYFAVGNHEYMYSMDSMGGYDAALELFKKETKMPDVNYSGDINGIKYIVIGSDEKSTAGAMDAEQLAWFKAEMAKVNQKERVFIFLHQPLYQTVIGSHGMNGEADQWYGITNACEEIKRVLQSYSNAILFTGHTHYGINTLNSIIHGYGDNANYVNVGAISYIYNDAYEEVIGSHGYFVEVYDSYILLRGRDFIERKWLASAQYIIYKN